MSSSLIPKVARRRNCCRRAAEHIDRACIRARQLNCLGHDRLQHRVEIERRIDGLADFAERLELADRPGKLGRARLHLLNRRTFSIAITAWSAKVVSRSICLRLNGRFSRRRITSTPMASSSRRSGVASVV